MSDHDYSKSGPSNGLQTIETSLEVDELHMRENLGLNGRGRPQSRAQISGAPKQRHRFVQDGEVQVTHITGMRDNDAANATRAKIATLENNLVTEQAARSRAEHAVQAGIAQIHAIETKLAHVELAAKDMIDAERSARLRAEAALSTAIADRDQAHQQIVELTESVKHLRAEAAKVQDPVKQVVRLPKTKAAPRAKTPRVKEPKPVKWWLAKSTVKTAKVS